MIDVIMITKNSAEHSPIFERVLTRLYQEVPVSRLLLVDGHSTDETVDIARQYPCVAIYPVPGNRAVARQFGIAQVETEWFLFLDDDVLLGPQWWKIAQKHMADETVGMIWGWDRLGYEPTRNRMKIMVYLRRMDEHALMVKNFAHRGGTHDTLIRTKAVETIQIPPDLHVYEDWYIKEHVMAQGYTVVAPDDLYCYHVYRPTFTPHALYEIARLQKKYGLQSGLVTLRNLVLAVPKALAILLFTRDWEAMSDQLKMYVYNFIGRFVYG